MMVPCGGVSRLVEQLRVGVVVVLLSSLGITVDLLPHRTVCSELVGNTKVEADNISGSTGAEAEATNPSKAGAEENGFSDVDANDDDEGFGEAEVINDREADLNFIPCLA